MKNNPKSDLQKSIEANAKKLQETNAQILKEAGLDPEYTGKVIIKRKNGTRRVVSVNQQPSLTDQSFKMDCDTNTIMEKFRRTGNIPHIAKRAGVFADVSNVQDLLPSLLKVKAAETEFNQMDAKVRRRFDNSTTKMLSFLDDPRNNAEAIELGLRVRPEKPKPSIIDPGKQTQPGKKPIKTTEPPATNDDK